VEFTAVILEKDTKHKLPEANKYRTLKDLARVFTNSSNPHRSLDSNRAFAAEFEEELAKVPGYSEDPTLRVFLCVCEGLILKWQRAHFDSLSRGGKRTSASGQVQVDDSSRPKRVRAEQGAYATGDNNHCEGCGIPRHRRDQCQMSDHPDWNSRGLWIESGAFAVIKKRHEAAGEQDKHPKLKWNEFAKGGTITNAKFPDKHRMDRAGDRTVQADRSKADDAADKSRIYGVARKSTPDEQGYKVKERGVQFNVPKDRDGRGGNNYLSSLLSKSSSNCDCDDADIDTTYRMCCVSVGNSPSYEAATSFDTGAHASFVNREVASWIEEHGGTDRQVPGQKRGWQEASSTTVPLAGTSMSSPILGSVVFRDDMKQSRTFMRKL
jgi:hypothetical protein